MGLCSKLWNLHIHCTIWWYYRLSTQNGPLTRIGRSHFIFILLYSQDELGHHTKFYQNRSKNKKVTPFVLSAQLALEINYERDNVWKSQFLKITCSNHILTAIVMPPGIFQLVISMVMTYCKVTEIFITLGIFCHAGRSEDELKTINLLWKGQCPKVVNELFWVVRPWRVSFSFLFFSSMS